MKNKLMALMLSLTLAACASIGTQPSTSMAQNKQIKIACASISTSIKTLHAADMAGKLSAANKAQVNKALAISNPVCLAPKAPTLSDLELQALQQASALLFAKAGAK